MTPQTAPAGGLASLQRAGVAPAVPMPNYPWKTRLLLPGLIVLALSATATWAARSSLLPATGVHVVPVVPRTVAVGAAAATGVVAQAAGWVEADPYPIAVTALADGIVRDVLVLEGAPVKAGDVIVRLVDEDAKLAVARAEAERAIRLADVQAAQATWDHPFERDRTLAAAKADLELSIAERQKVDSEIAAESAKVDELVDILARLEKRGISGVASELELANTRFRLQGQRASAEAARARAPMLSAAIRKREADLAAATEGRERRIEESRTLESAKAALALAEAQLAEARLRLSRMEIRSPSDGIVMNRLVAPGSKLMLSLDNPASSHVARLYDPRRLQVRVDVPLADAAKVGVGMRCQVVVEVLPDRTFNGEVVRVVNEADVTRNTLQFKVRIDTPAAELKPEMLARVRFLGGNTTTGPAANADALFVPERLVHSDAGADFVWLADRRLNVAQRRTVTRGSARREDWIALSTGIAAGDELIARPADLRDGQRIRILGEFKSANGEVH